MTDPAPESPPSLPPPFDRVGDRPFSFYPPIVNIRHNEWIVKEATWSEVLVANAKSTESIWIPRSFIGDLSRVDEPVMIVGLKRELEFKAGAVWPHAKRVLEMPRGGIAPPPASGDPAPQPTGFGSSSGSAAPNESRIGRLILVTLLLGIGLCALVISYYRGLNSAESATYEGIMQTSLGLSGRDDIHAVKRKLGEPGNDRWVAQEEGVLQFRLLDYPARQIKVVLMGRERDQATYIGAIDRQGRVVDSVDLPGGANTAATVRQAAKR